MKFFNARCETCGQYHDNPDDMLAFTVRGGVLKVVALGGEQPWSGVRVICHRCIKFFKDNAEECPACIGDGEVEVIQVGESQFAPCEECGGTGLSRGQSS